MSALDPPVIVIDDFVGPEAADRLLRYAVEQQPAFTASTVALADASVVDTSRRASLVLHDLDPVLHLLEPAVRKAVDAAIPELGLVNVDAYVLETELARHGDGSFFRRHDDTVPRDRVFLQRVLTLVYYLHREPKPFRDGQLRIYGLAGRSDECLAEIEPRSDRAVLFPSWFPHEVRPVRCDSEAFSDGRFAVNCWVRRIPQSHV
jgi:SM-20-related protein